MTLVLCPEDLTSPIRECLQILNTVPPGPDAVAFTGGMSAKSKSVSETRSVVVVMGGGELLTQNVELCQEEGSNFCVMTFPCLATRAGIAISARVTRLCK